MIAVRYFLNLCTKELSKKTLGNINYHSLQQNVSINQPALHLSIFASHLHQSRIINIPLKAALGKLPRDFDEDGN